MKLQTDGLPVAVLGGGLIGTEAAETLSLLGLPVTVFELGSEIAKDLNKNRRYFVMERLRMGRVSLLTGAGLRRFWYDTLCTGKTKFKLPPFRGKRKKSRPGCPNTLHRRCETAGNGYGRDCRRRLDGRKLSFLI